MQLRSALGAWNSIEVSKRLVYQVHRFRMWNDEVHRIAAAGNSDKFCHNPLSDKSQQSQQQHREPYPNVCVTVNIQRHQRYIPLMASCAASGSSAADANIHNLEVIPLFGGWLCTRFRNLCHLCALRLSFIFAPKAFGCSCARARSLSSNLRRWCGGGGVGCSKQESRRICQSPAHYLSYVCAPTSSSSLSISPYTVYTYGGRVVWQLCVMVFGLSAFRQVHI